MGFIGLHLVGEQTTVAALQQDDPTASFTGFGYGALSICPQEGWSSTRGHKKTHKKTQEGWEHAGILKRGRWTKIASSNKPNQQPKQE